MIKIIHYCWFGGKPLPKLAQKCLESWKKFLPDFEIKRWDETNCNIEECEFVKQAYEQKKWAFVADYFRCKALNEFGGLYFDTDMEIKKDIKDLLNDKTVLGVEDTGYVAVGIWYEPKPKGYITKKLLEKYRSFKNLEFSKINQISIPILLSEVLSSCGLKNGSPEIQNLKNSITIYPRDYFYPLSYNHENNIFTDNTRTIHYYDASWINWKQKLELFLVRKIGRKNVVLLEKIYFKLKHIIRKIIKLCFFPLVLIRRYKNYLNSFGNEYEDRINNTIEQINKYSKKTVVFYNKYWMGTASATKELFENIVDCGELLRKKDINKIRDAIIENEINQLIFSAFAKGWNKLIIAVKQINPDIKVKTFWHGSHSQILDAYGWERNREIIALHKKGLIEVMGTCKYSLMPFYKHEGYNAKFITNKVDKPNISNQLVNKKNENEKRIGIYAAKCDDWRKNMFTQIAAASLIENVVIDMVPLNETAKEFAKTIGVKIEGKEKSIPREELMERMSRNDVNLYVTLSECSPMLPLESMELGVPCITGNNHHYFLNSKLEDYIVVFNESNVEEIKEKIELCLNKKEKIITLYDAFAKDNLKKSKQNVKEFLDM